MPYPDHDRRTRLRCLVAAVLGLFAVLGLGPAAATVGTPAPPDPDEVEIRLASNRADLISGGDALVEVRLPAGADAAGVRVEVSERDVTAAFAVRPSGRYEGLVTGLALGPNVVAARLADGRGATLTVTNHPSSGPVFSGPHLQPWTCRPGALDEYCSRSTAYEFVYRSTDRVYDETCDAVPSTVTNRVPEASAPPCFQPYDPADPPDDVATVTNDRGETVPFIVRLEKGTIDRDEYRVAVLFDPQLGWDRWAPQRGWNGKLLIKHGSSCGGTYGEVDAPDVLDESRALSRGFAVMSTALNNSGHSCNPVIQAESMIMAKEHVIETYGDVRYTMGRGGSGGALAQQWVANSYPGLYDGLLVSQSFPDGWSTAQEIEDCALLHGYWSDPSAWAPGVAWTPAQQGAVEGHLSTSVCHSWTTVYGYQELADPSLGRGCGVPARERYDAVTNAEGVRCSLQDYTVNVLGRRAQDGFANRPYDNVGVQYGLSALQEGRLTPAQFVDLNAKVGSHDIDYIGQPTRVAADPGAAATAYRSGLVNEANNLTDVAIIDLRGTNTAELHHHVRTWTMRERLVQAQGHHENHLIWWGPIATSGDQTFSSAAFDLMDAWLRAVEADDRTHATAAEKLLANKPPQARDRCTDGAGHDVAPVLCQVPDATPRMAAGAPPTDDIIACTLTPLDRGADYGPVPFPDAEWTQMEAVFPSGVCDFGTAGEGQQPTQGWLTYENGPGGRPMGSPPLSVPLPPDVDAGGGAGG